MTGKRTNQSNHIDNIDNREQQGQVTDPDSTETPAAETDDSVLTAEEQPHPAGISSDELEEINNRHLRLAADFENFKKRARQERLEHMQYASARLAEQLLPVVDDFDRAIAHVPEGIDENWLKGVRMTVGKLHEALASVGVEPIEAVGSRFDPKLHEAIATEESAEHPEDTVLDEVRRGYKMHDRVLRPAMVRVTRLPAGEPGNE